MIRCGNGETRGEWVGWRSQIGARGVRVLATFPSDGAIPLFPEGDTVASTDLFDILEQASRASDDAAGQSLS